LQATVIETPYAQSIDYLLYPDSHPGTRMFVERQFENFTNSLTAIGRQFMEASKHIYTEATDSVVARAARAAVSQVKTMFHPNSIVPLETLEELQMAKSVMQRYIMAEPTIRTLYHKQRCDGYSDTYVDMHPGKVEVNHYDYRRVTQNVVLETVDEDGNDTWIARTYAEDLLEGDRELTRDEQFQILSSWDAIKRYVEANNEDPTNPYGGKLS
jgi:hypothetical protein